MLQALDKSGLKASMKTRDKFYKKWLLTGRKYP